MKASQRREIVLEYVRKKVPVVEIARLTGVSKQSIYNDLAASNIVRSCGEYRFTDDNRDGATKYQIITTVWQKPDISPREWWQV